MEYITKNEKEIDEIARKFFLQSSFGDIFALNGDLGSGKTTFVKAFAKAAGINQTITSPTFVILKRYLIPSGDISPKKYLIHVDCYRMENEDDALAIGLPEYLENDNNIIFIEWPQKIAKILPKRVKHINFEYINETTRKITIN